MKSKHFSFILLTLSMFTGLYLLASTLLLGKTTTTSSTLNINNPKEYPYIEETTYEKKMRGEVEPTLAKLRKSGTLTTSKDISIYYETYEVKEPLGHIVISHGFTESPEKYYELIYYFTQNGYSVYIPAHQGHGQSTRLVEDLSLVHIKSFDDYIIDLTCFIEDIVLPSVNEESVYLYGHSMGGGIAALYLEQNPNIVDAAILSSPMLEVELGNTPNFLAKTLATTASLFGQKEKYVFTHHPFDSALTLEEGSIPSPARYDYYFQKRLEDPSLQTNGASFNWLKEALKATDRMIENAAEVTVPVLLFQSEQDTWVGLDGQIQFAEKAPYCELIVVPEASHELYLESDKILFPYLDSIFSFLEENNKPVD